MKTLTNLDTLKLGLQLDKIIEEFEASIPDDTYKVPSIESIGEVDIEFVMTNFLSKNCDNTPSPSLEQIFNFLPEVPQ